MSDRDVSKANASSKSHVFSPFVVVVVYCMKFCFVVFMSDRPQCSGRSDRDLGNKQWQVPYSHILYLYQRGRSRMSDGDVR